MMKDQTAKWRSMSSRKEAFQTAKNVRPLTNEILTNSLTRKELERS
jgi:hypothetical protein